MKGVALKENAYSISRRRNKTKMPMPVATSETMRPLAPNREPRRSHEIRCHAPLALSCSTANRVVCASQNGIVFIVSTHHMLHCLAVYARRCQQHRTPNYQPFRFGRQSSHHASCRMMTPTPQKRWIYTINSSASNLKCCFVAFL